jgi:predicted N-acyltransferase
VGDGYFGTLAGIDRHQATNALAEALTKYAKAESISLIVIKDLAARYRPETEPLLWSGFTRLDGYPPLKLDLRFKNFEMYLEQKLGRITRKGIRRKLRVAAAAAPPITLEVRNECSEVIDEIYPLYAEVARRSDVQFEVFTREYFVEAGRRMPERCRFFIWRQGGKAVAFSFCSIWKDAIYDNDIGLDYSVAHQLNLYHVTFRDIMNWALEHDLKTYFSAPFNYDPKLLLRLEPIPVDLYVRHRAPLINLALRLFAPFLAPAHSDPALRKYLAAKR